MIHSTVISRAVRLFALVAAVFTTFGMGTLCSHAAPLRIATFNIDATPPVGTALCDALVPPVKEVTDKLTCRGVILLGDDKPIVLVALDWVGVGNSGYDAFRTALAAAVDTTPQRVAVHSTHAHDAPGCDFETEELLAKHGLSGAQFDPKFARDVIDRAAKAAKDAVGQARAVTHLGLGKAKIENVASNRRVLGPDGKVKWTRTSATRDPEARAQPEGTVDPYIWLVAFFDGEKAVAALTYYATHPQSHYGKGLVSCDFPGLARNEFEKSLAGPLCVHFNGAGGNVTAGKYNDGNPANRALLTQRVAQGMTKAWESIRKTPVVATDIRWNSVPVALPAATWLKEDALLKTVIDEKVEPRLRVAAARQLTWLRRCQKGHKIDVACLTIGEARVLYMPGELFVEYQLAAQALRPDSFVAMAAYGDYGMGYIGTKIAYTQGGYETGPASRVAPEVEAVLMGAVKELLK